MNGKMFYLKAGFFIIAIINAVKKAYPNTENK